MKNWNDLEMRLATESGYKKIIHLEAEIPEDCVNLDNRDDYWFVTSYRLDEESAELNESDNIIEFDGIKDVEQWIRRSFKAEDLDDN